MLDRVNLDVQPWNGNDALRELYRRGYNPRSSRRSKGGDVDPLTGEEIGRWPEILKRCVEGGAMLAISLFGAALFYLHRSLVGE